MKCCLAVWHNRYRAIPYTAVHKAHATTELSCDHAHTEHTQAMTEYVAADGTYVSRLNTVDIASRMSDKPTWPSAADLTDCLTYRKASIEMLSRFSKDALNLAPTPHGKYIADGIKLPRLLSSHQNFQNTGKYFHSVTGATATPFPSDNSL